uniref:Uncharacterized protein n=1 Tax=Anguilla anguilla TaxID=7936 RepID=A0A0E9QKG4_ANGAN
MAEIFNLHTCPGGG